MNDHDIVLRIQELMDGVEWDDNTLDSIAAVLEYNGYIVRQPLDDDVDALLAPVVTDRSTTEFYNMYYGGPWWRRPPHYNWH